MADLSEIKKAAQAAAQRALEPTDVVDVQVEHAMGQDGEAVLRITIVVPDGQFDDIDGGRFLRTLTDVQGDVRETGDERFAIVGYATPSELIDDGDPEP